MDQQVLWNHLYFLGMFKYLIGLSATWHAEFCIDYLCTLFLVALPGVKWPCVGASLCHAENLAPRQF